MMKNLSYIDVGCGPVLRGDVNVDLLSPQFSFSKQFVQADALHLPFRSKVFDQVTCFHLMEEVNNPYYLLEELMRVNRGLLIIKVPYRFGGLAKSPDHKHYFNKRWFQKILDQQLNVFYHISVNFDRERDILKFPLELTIKIWRYKNG